MNQNKFQNVINKIKLLVSDVDGVLTDGKFLFHQIQKKVSSLMLRMERVLLLLVMQTCLLHSYLVDILKALP